MAGYNKKTSVITTTPARLSRRLRGEMPIEHVTDYCLRRKQPKLILTCLQFELDDILDDHDRVKQLEIAENKKQEQEIVINNLPNDISVPFTLRSIGTTVWSLGELVKGRGRSKAWSSRGVKRERKR